MSGWDTIQRIKRMEQEIDKLGFKFKQPKHGDWERQEQSISLVPKDATVLPIYSRDAELFVGSLEQLETWLHGVEWARNYDMMLRLSDDDKRAKAEQKERNKNLMRTIKESKLVTGEAK
jgi:ABC-type lipopolysaccharide export system ATPase subunit